MGSREIITQRAPAEPFIVTCGWRGYWSHSPVRPEFSYFVVSTAIFMVIAMWIFPEAGVKKGDLKK